MAQLAVCAGCDVEARPRDGAHDTSWLFDWFCPACSETEEGMFVPVDASQLDAADDALSLPLPLPELPAAALPPLQPPHGAHAEPAFRRPTVRPAGRPARPSVSAPPASLQAPCHGALAGILAAMAAPPAPLPERLYAGTVLRAEPGPVGGQLWSGGLSLSPERCEGLPADGAARLAAACQALTWVARPLVVGPGSGPEGVDRAVAVSRLLPASLPALCVLSAGDELPCAGELLAMLRFGGAGTKEESLVAQVVSFLEANDCALLCDLHVRLWLLPPTALPAAMRAPQRGCLSSGCLIGLVVELPLPQLTGVPCAQARPARAIMRPPQPQLPQGPGYPAAEAAEAPAVGAALRGLRFTLLGFVPGDTAAQHAVQGAQREGALHECSPSPHNVDLVVLEPGLLRALPEFRVAGHGIADFLAVRRVRLVLGCSHIEACVAARSRLEVRGGEQSREVFPEGVLLVSDACTLASGDGVARTVLTLLCRCAAAANAAAAACARTPPGALLPKPCSWPWRLMLAPGEWAALRAAAPCSPYACEAVAAVEEALSGRPGPGVGSTGGPRAGLLSPEEQSRSAVADPPQQVRDAVKLAALHAHDCRHVFLMTTQPAVLESLRQQRSIQGGTPGECGLLFAQLLAQARAEARAPTAAAATPATQPQERARRVRFQEGLELLPRVTCAKLSLKREREFVVREPAAKTAALEETE